MQWIRPLTALELFFILLFALLYIVYIVRVIQVGRVLNTSFYNVFVKLFIRTAYFALIIIAILGPSFGQSSREIKSVGKDIFFAIDLSESMNAFDIQPTRLEKVKFELKKIVNAFETDRIGLIIFSSESFMQCPLTFDHNALNMFIEILHTGLVPNTGTDFGPPLKMALQKLDNTKSPLTQQKSKTIILISDGEDFGEDTETVVKDIENQGIKLFTLGVGTEQGSKIRTSKGFKKDRGGNEVITQLSSKSLQNIAIETDGKYFEINNGTNDVERLINAINNIEGEVRDVKQVDVSANKYLYFLLIAAGLILFDSLVSIKVIRI
ncbi:MAG: VWA domain-containing protein [Cyclobacteriaceae bacterium]|nr:VWA domain-containing protein [Cyclobacteriaceae bacterium]